MDINIITLNIVNAITDFTFYDALVSKEISDKASSTEKHNKIREKSGHHLATLFADTKFVDSKGKLLSFDKIKDIVLTKINPLSKKEVEDFVDILQKDAKKIAKLYKELSKK